MKELISTHSDTSVNSALNRVKGCLNYSLKEKYGIDNEKTTSSILKIHGLHKDNFEFINNFEALIEKGINNDSVDTNANKSEITINGLGTEIAIPVQKIIGYRYLYRKMVEMYGKKRAKFLMGEMYDYSLALADSSKILMPYSYYKHTPIFVRINGKEEYITMGKLFKKYSNFLNKTENMEYIETKDIKKNVLFTAPTLNNRNRKSNGDFLDVNEDILIEVWDNDKFVKINQLTKHKQDEDKDFVLYQSGSGDFALVTEDHPVILEDGAEVLARELVNGMKIKDANIDIPFVKEYINVPEKLAYFLGFLLGDGNIHSYDKNNEYTDSPVGCIDFTRGGNLVTLYQNDIENSKILKITKELFPNANIFSFNNSTDKKDRVRSFSSPELSALVAAYFDYDCKENSFTKHLPSNFLNWKEKSKSAFIAGLIDSDGTVSAKGRVDIRLKSYATINVLFDALNQIEGLTSINKRIEGKTPKEFMYSVAFNSSSETIYSWSEKLQLLEKELVFSNDERYIRSKNSNEIFKVYKFNREELDKTSFGYNELEYVYDISTETGTFIANGMVQHNCFAVNASRLTSEGRPFGKLHSTPAKRPDSYISSLNETIHQLSNVVAGALAPTTIFLDVAKLMITSGEGTLTSIVKDKEYRKTMENEFQHFIHSMNSLSRSATESPFTNVSLFDRPKLQALLEDDNMGWYFTEIENKPDDFFTLADEGTELYNNDWKKYITELVIELQWLFTEIMDRGDVANGGAAITFPVTTVNLSKKKNADGVYEIEDKKFLKKFCTKEIYRYNIYASEGTKVASCCRLINDSELMSMGGQVNSFGGTSISLGSHRVNTINLKRISIETRKALEGKNATAEEALAVYKEILNDRMDSASDVLKAHKELLKDFTDMKTQQFIENGWLDLDKMFSTFGLIGYYEANKDLKENFGGDLDYLKEILTFIEDRAKEISVAKKMIINIEQIPGESMMQRLAIVDRALFGKEYVPEEIYANQFVPLFENGHTLWERMEVDGEYGSYLTGGGICHFSLGEKVTPKQAEKIIVFAVENNSEHFALNPVFSVCSNETPHTTFGKSEMCPVCGKPIRTYITRTIGFFTAVEDWSDRKKKEDFDKRDYTSIDG